jgi:hypothetical protein
MYLASGHTRTSSFALFLTATPAFHLLRSCILEEKIPI